MADDDPQRMDQIRKYAAIYGRFDCKRKPEKPLTLHEVITYTVVYITVLYNVQYYMGKLIIIELDKTNRVK